MQNLNVQFGSTVALRNRLTSQYFSYHYHQNGQKVDACGAPPSIRLSHRGNQVNFPDQRRQFLTDMFRIVSCTPRDTRTGVTYGSKVYLINEQGQYLLCVASGDIRLDKPSLADDMNNLLFRTATWLLQDVNNNLSKKQITVYDDVVIKSVFGNMMTCDEHFNVTANGALIGKASTWNIMKAAVPYIPQWVYLRPTLAKHMTLSSDGMGLGRMDMPRKEDKKLLSSYSLQVQQWYLIQDILDIMLGFEGVYIKKRGEGKSLNFVIEPHLESASCDSSLYQLCQKIFIVPLNYLIIENYIATNSIENGTVCQALTGAMRMLLKQFKMLVIQLDQEVKNGLTLQKMWYYLQPSNKILESLVLLIRDASNLRGGPLLSCIFTTLSSTTDQEIRRIYCLLFNKSLVVYIKLMEKWIYQGIISDKHEQFMVAEQPEIRKDNPDYSYWDERFTLRREQVPIFFKKDEQIILMTGKYLNVVGECGAKKVHPFKGQLTQTIDKCLKQQDFTEPLQTAYNWANEQLNNLIIKEKQLPSLLKSMKGFFFMEYGDFFVHYLDAAEKYLCQTRSKYVSTEKLQSLLELCIKTSTANHDPFNDEISCKIDNLTIFEQVQRIKSLEPRKFNFNPAEKPMGATTNSKYLDFFTLEIKVQFPLNLIINRKMLSKYQVLFRHLFWCKYIERQLHQTWQVLQATKETPLPCYMHAYGLNQRMLHYCKNMVYNLSYEVIEHHWQRLMENLKKVRRFEDVIQYHEEFLDTCLRESLLMNDTLIKIVVVELGNSCQGFFSIKTYIESLNAERPRVLAEGKHEEVSSKESAFMRRKRKMKENLESISSLMESKNFSHFVRGFVVCFDKALKRLLEQIYRLVNVQEGHLANLLTRLDSQGFYTQRLRIALTGYMMLQNR